MREERDACITLNVSYPVMDAETYRVTDIAQLRRLLGTAMSSELAELWLERRCEEEERSSLSIWKNGDQAWLMFLPSGDEAGFHSSNPAYTGPPNATLMLYLENGQADEKPLSEWVADSEAIRAAEHFWLYGEKAPWLHWQDDSQ